MAKTPQWRYQNADGSITVVYTDGSFVVVDPRTGAVTKQEDSPNPMLASAFASGDTSALDQIQKDASAENARRWDQTFNQKADEIEKTYRVNMMNARTNADAQRATAQYQRDQTQLARDRLAFDRETQAQEFGLKQANLGYNLVNTAANLRGPSNYFQASNYARGVAAQPGTSTFLSALQNNTRLADFGAQAAAPDAETLGTLSAKLTGGTDLSGDDGYLDQIHAIAARGGGQLGAGTWEQLSPTERKLFLSGLEAPDSLGKAYDADTFLSQWRRSRIGQGFGTSKAA